MLRQDAQPRGYYENADHGLAGFSVTPGYETYAGLGWYGVIAQQPRDTFE